MAERVQKTLIEEGIEIGEKRGEKRRIRDKAESILMVLRTRFKQVPQEISDTLFQMNDPIALDSLLCFAVTCVSIKDFADSLK